MTEIKLEDAEMWDDPTIPVSDLLKIRDTLKDADKFFSLRDEMNAKLHKSDNVRNSPLASEVKSTLERVEFIIRFMKDRANNEAGTANLEKEEDDGKAT